MELNPRDPAHWPFIGSVVDYVDERRQPGEPKCRATCACPGLQQLAASASPSRAPGRTAGFLGQPYDPIWTEFVGEATRSAKTLDEQTWDDLEPYRGHHPREPVPLGARPTTLPDELTLDRLDRRRTLLDQLDAARPGVRRSADASADSTGIDAASPSLLASAQSRQAFDLGREPIGDPRAATA